MPRSHDRAVLLPALAAALLGCQPGAQTDGPPAPPTAPPAATPTPTPEGPAQVQVNDVDYQPTDRDRADLPALTQGGARFAAALYGQLRAAPPASVPKNIFFSPLSIRSALAMTYAGARGDTAAQMASALDLQLPADRVHSAHAAQRAALAGAVSGEQVLAIANRLWGQRGEGFLQSFLQLTRSYYGAGLAELDFRGDAEGARQTINTWVAELTRQKIPELIKPGVVDGSTALVLTNAIYFKGQWARRFDPAQTKSEPFQRLSGGPVQAPMMRQKARFAFAQDPLVHVVELPYVGDRLAMLLIVPKEKDGLARAEAALASGGLTPWLGALAPAEVDLSLPRFRVEADFELSAPLRALGMVQAFNPSADFSAINGRPGLFISAVVHSAFVEVQEEGTEAAAATGVVMTRSLPQVHRVAADRPFIFAIRDRESGALLFLGRLVDPSA
jgi:serpin B